MNAINQSTINYIVVGVGGTLVYLVLMIVLVEVFDVDPVIATMISFFPVFLGSYYLSHVWVFNSKNSHRHAFIRYAIVTGLGFSINTVGMYMAVYVLGLWYLSSQCVIFILVAMNNYLLNRFWTF